MSKRPNPPTKLPPMNPNAGSEFPAIPGSENDIARKNGAFDRRDRAQSVGAFGAEVARLAAHNARLRRAASERDVLVPDIEMGGGNNGNSGQNPRDYDFADDLEGNPAEQNHYDIGNDPDEENHYDMGDEGNFEQEEIYDEPQDAITDPLRRRGSVSSHAEREGDEESQVSTSSLRRRNRQIQEDEESQVSTSSLRRRNRQIQEDEESVASFDASIIDEEENNYDMPDGDEQGSGYEVPQENPNYVPNYDDIPPVPPRQTGQQQGGMGPVITFPSQPQQQQQLRQPIITFPNPQQTSITDEEKLPKVRRPLPLNPERKFDHVREPKLQEKEDKLRKAMNDLAVAIMALKNPSPEQIEKLIAKSGLADVKTISLDAKEISNFVSEINQNKKLSSPQAMKLVGFTLGQGNDQNHIKWGHDASDPHYLYQKLFLAHIQRELQKTGSVVRDQHMQQTQGEEAGLGLAYHDFKSDTSNGQTGIDPFSMGTAMWFEHMIQQRHEKLTKNSVLGGDKDLSFYKTVSFNQFVAFTRYAMEADSLRYDKQILDILHRQNDIDSEIATLSAAPAPLSPTDTKKLDELNAEKARLDELYLSLENKLNETNARSALEFDALFGPNGKGDLSLGLERTNRYAYLFTQIMEDKKVAGKESLLETVLAVDQKRNPRLFTDQEIAELEKDRLKVLSLSIEQLGAIFDASENRIATKTKALIKGDQSRNALPIRKILDAQDELAAKFLKDGKRPEQWTDAERSVWTAKLAKLGWRQQDWRNREIAKAANEDEKKYRRTFNQAEIDQLLAEDGLPANIQAIVDKYDQAVALGEFYLTKIREVEKEGAKGIYEFKPINLEDADIDELNIDEVDDSGAAAFRKDGKREYGIDSIKGDRIELYKGGVAVKVFEGDDGYVQHSRQVDALKAASFKDGEPRISIARFDNLNEFRQTQNKICITVAYNGMISKTFVTPAKFNEILDENKKENIDYAVHISKVEGLKELALIIKVAAGDRLKNGEVARAKMLLEKVEKLENLIKETEILPEDDLETRRDKLNNLNHFPDENFASQSKDFNKLADRLNGSHTLPDITKLNEWIEQQVTNSTIRFELSDTPDDILTKRRELMTEMEFNKNEIVPLRRGDLSQSLADRVGELQKSVLLGKQVSVEAKKQAKVYAAQSTNARLSGAVKRSEAENRYTTGLDPATARAFLHKFNGGGIAYSGKYSWKTGFLPIKLTGASDGKLWQNTKDFLKTMQTPMPVAPIGGSPKIVKMRVERDKSTMNADGSDNHSWVVFPSDENGNYTGDNRAYVGIPGTELYVEVTIARKDGVGNDGKMKVKGEITINPMVFYKGYDGKYTSISLDKNFFTNSDMTKKFGKMNGDELRRTVENFSVNAGSTDANGQLVSMATMYGGAVMEDHEHVIKKRLSPFRDPESEGRNIATEFHVDEKMLVKPSKALDPLAQFDIKHYPGYKVVASAPTLLQSFKAEKNPGFLRDFNFVLRVACITDETSKKPKQEYVKDEVFIETFDAKGNAQYRKLDDIADLEDITSDEVDRAYLIKQARDLAKSCDVAVSLVHPDNKKQEVAVLRNYNRSLLDCFKDTSGKMVEKTDRSSYAEQLHLKKGHAVTIDQDPSGVLTPATAAYKVGITQGKQKSQ